MLQEWSRFSHELLMLSFQTRFCCQNILYFSVWSYEPITDCNLLNIELKLLLCHQILSFMTFWRQDVSDLNIFHSIIIVRVATVAAFFTCFCSSRSWQSVRELFTLKSVVEVISLHIICPHSCSEQHFTLLWHWSRSSQTSCSQQYNAATAPCFTSHGNGSFIIIYSRSPKITIILCDPNMCPKKLIFAKKNHLEILGYFQNHYFYNLELMIINELFPNTSTPTIIFALTYFLMLSVSVTYFTRIVSYCTVMMIWWCGRGFTGDRWNIHTTTY